jgi:hypothetical protein
VEIGCGRQYRQLLSYKRKDFEYRYLKPALADFLIEFTFPDKPTSSKQKYRLTE